MKYFNINDLLLNQYRGNCGILYNVLYKFITIIYWIGIILCTFIFIQIFCFRAFKIPSNSMSPAVATGDHVIVNKMIPGACLFNIFAYMRNEQVDILRIPGIGKIQRNDVIVFNFPYPNNENKVEMSLLNYYIKRCVGLPGDTLLIQNGHYITQNFLLLSGTKKQEDHRDLRMNMLFQREIDQGFPHDSIIDWNVENMGPLYIPKIGDSIQMNRTNFVLYKKLIEWEQKDTLTYKDSMVFSDNKRMEGYRFQKNYYFIAGDYSANSQDSRYWGLLPEDFIVGKAWIIWKSKNPYTGEFRWDRFMKMIH